MKQKSQEWLNSEAVFKVTLHHFVLSKQTKKAIKLPLAFYKIFLNCKSHFFKKKETHLQQELTQFWT